MKERSRRRARELLGQEPLLEDDRANYFGRTSRSAFQVRGNGCLALGDHRLVFAQWWPRRDLVIDRSAITAVDSVGSHLGKTIGRRLLRVSFAGESAAWYVRSLDQWLATLS